MEARKQSRFASTHPSLRASPHQARIISIGPEKLRPLRIVPAHLAENIIEISPKLDGARPAAPNALQMRLDRTGIELTDGEAFLFGDGLRAGLLLEDPGR
jgi:hypothetical protein